jgi:integrase
MPAELRTISKVLTDDEITERRERASEWRKANCWHPHQIRHTTATLIRKEFGIEATRTVLGHASAGITEVYAELDQGKAREVMARIG